LLAVRKKILTEKQELLISHLPEEIQTNFYLTGGTALSAFYLGHRFSEDMDFFTDAEEKMAPIEFLTGIIRSLPALDHLHFERLFDRRIFVATFQDNQILKVEFTSYPFKSLEDRLRVGKLSVDSLLNLVTGKLFAMADRFDPKDFVDLYFVLKKKGLTLENLLKLTEERFDVKGLEFVIPERLLLIDRIAPKDLPVMVEKMDLDEMKGYYLQEATRLVKLRRGR
jgi:predicted nucleotidyltransferase component of viral defense system